MGQLKDLFSPKNKNFITMSMFLPPEALMTFVEAGLIDEQDILDLIENINGVMSFVGTKESPQPLKSHEIDRLIGSIDSEDANITDIEIPFKVGDSVRVIDGPFKDFDGLVQEINDKNRIKVNVNIFGRPTPIELSFNQIVIDN